MSRIAWRLCEALASALVLGGIVGPMVLPDLAVAFAVWAAGIAVWLVLNADPGPSRHPLVSAFPFVLGVQAALDALVPFLGDAVVLVAMIEAARRAAPRTHIPRAIVTAASREHAPRRIARYPAGS